MPEGRCCVAKPNAKKLAQDQQRYAQFQLERVMGDFMGMDGAQAVRSLTDMFGERPELLELNGRSIVQ